MMFKLLMAVLLCLGEVVFGKTSVTLFLDFRLKLLVILNCKNLFEFEYLDQGRGVYFKWF